MSDRQDMKEYQEVMHDLGPPITRCKGGRIIASGYSCTHCGSVDPQTECKSPRREQKEKAAA